MFSPAHVQSASSASMGENALNMAHAAATCDPALLNQYFNHVSMMFPSQLQPTAEAPVARPQLQSHPKFDPSDLGPAPEGTNPLLDTEPRDPRHHIHLDMVGITATVHFRCQFNIDALRNYADRNEKKFVPSRCGGGQ